MVKTFFSLITILAFASCDTKLEDLSMLKIPYTGAELRIDGYYYSNPIYDQYSHKSHLYITVFYRDGFCIHTSTNIEGTDTLNHIENDILLNDNYINKLKNDPADIGAFRIVNSDVEIEAWAFRAWTFTYYGRIVNDTTFITYKRIYHNGNKDITYEENLTYKFKQFSPKPDSTNIYVK